MKVIQIPLAPPSHSSLFRLQRYTNPLKLPPEIRNEVDPLESGESYYLALGGPSGFSGGSIQYPHRQRAGPYEMAIGEERDDGLHISTFFLHGFWVSESHSCAETQSSVRVTCGRYLPQPSGADRWEQIVDMTVPNSETIVIPESDLVRCTHLRLSDAKIRPILVVRATSTPAWEPIFVAPLCVVEIE